MTAPTLWEEGHLSGSRVIRLAVLSLALLVVVDLLVLSRLSVLYDVGYVAVCIGAALAVRPKDFFRVGVVPPFLMVAVVLVLAIAQPGAIAAPTDGFVQALVSGMAHHAGALFAGYVNCLVVLAVRHRVMTLRADKEARRSSPYAVQLVPALPEQSRGQEKRDGSPRPTRATSGTPEEKSTTVVGSAFVSPESRTASNL